MKLARRIFALHSWLGLIAGLFILVFFLTGSVIVFREELNLWEHPHLLRVAPKAQRLPYQTIYERVSTQVADTYLYSFRRLPRTPGETIEMRIYEPSTKRYGLLYVNPYNGEVLGKTFDSLYDILLTIHYEFYLGKFGEFLAAIFALALLGSVITGLYVYRKSLLKVLLFQFNGKWTNWRTISSNLHRIMGVWGLLFNLILALSGFWMMKYALEVRTHFSSKPTVEETQEPPVVRVNLDKLVQQTLTLFGGRVNTVSFPRQEDAPVRIYATSPGQNWLYGEYSSYAEFDQQTGAVKTVFRELDLSNLERFEYTLYTLHFGQYGGLPIKILYAFMSLSGAVLTVTGFLLWYRRKKFRKQTTSIRASDKDRLRPSYSLKH